jgi:hypothetical protein
MLGGQTDAHCIVPLASLIVTPDGSQPLAIHKYVLSA